MGVEPTRRALRISPDLKSGRPTGDDALPYPVVYKKVYNIGYEINQVFLTVTARRQPDRI